MARIRRAPAPPVLHPDIFGGALLVTSTGRLALSRAELDTLYQELAQFTGQPAPPVLARRLGMDDELFPAPAVNQS